MLDGQHDQGRRHLHSRRKQRNPAELHGVDVFVDIMVTLMY